MDLIAQEYFTRLDALFHQAAELPAGEQREEFLKASTGGNPALLLDVSRLLERDSLLQESSPSREAALPRFGVYRATRIIGRGGMGLVYRATREDGQVDLEVAVKSLSSPLWSAVLEERFRRERQILAQLRHPNIAAFLDGGIADDGLPFLVMELVDGEPLDRFCNERQLPIRRRLEILLEVCRAVEFAHRQLIVHRDIKPNNILVTAAGEPKLLDFGLARSIELSVLPQENPTLFFTPLYASPEVLRGKPAAVTDDVYSLGVLLYKLLIGTGPFESQGTTPAEIVDAVLHSEPRKPSAILHAMESADAAKTATMRAETATSLHGLLNGDLDAIAMKAVNPSTADRYASIAELAEDLSRHLTGRAVRAIPDNKLYRARKFAYRHRGAVAALVVILLSLAAGAAATLWEAREAVRQRAAAERRFEEARALTRYMMFELQTQIQKLPGSTPIKADMVKHSMDYLDRVAAEKSNDNSLRVDIAEGYCELADVLGHPLRPNLGRAAEARDTYAKAIRILQPVVASNPKDPIAQRARRVLARAQLMSGMSQIFYRQWDEGGKLVTTASRELVHMAQTSPQDFEVQKEAALALDSVAVTLSQRDGYTTGGSDEAVRDLKQAIDYAEAALRLRPQDQETVTQLATSYNRLALITQTHDRPAAHLLFQQALAAMDRLPQEEKATAAIRNKRASVLLGMGWNLGSMGRFDEGLAAIDQARTTMEALVLEDPENHIYPMARASIYRNLGVIQEYAGHTAEALAAYKTSIAIYDKLLAANPNNPYFQTSLADIEANASLLSLKLGDREEANRLARSSVPILKKSAMRKDASAAELNLAARFLTERKLPEFCDAKLGLALAQRADAAADGKDYVVLQTLGQAYWINRDRENAVRSIERALSLTENSETSSQPTRVRKVYGETLTEYRNGKLPNGCPQYPPAP